MRADYSSSPMSGSGDKSTMRYLGEFFGHVMKGVRTDPAAPARPATRTRTEEELRETSGGRVVIRRTIIEEVVLPEQLPSVAATRTDGNPSKVDPRGDAS